MPYGTVEAATLAQHGPPPLSRSPVSTCRAHYPGGPVQVLCRCFPRSCCLPRTPGGSASTTSLSRPAQASLALRPVDSLARPRRTLSQGFDTADCSTEPPASYRANRPLPGWDLHPQGDRALRGAPEFRRVDILLALRARSIGRLREALFAFSVKLASQFCAKKAVGRRGWRRAGPGEEDPV